MDIKLKCSEALSEHEVPYTVIFTTAIRIPTCHDTNIVDSCISAIVVANII